MEPKRLLATAILPALNDLATLGIPSSVPAARLMIAIALQESGLKHRRQVVAGGAEAGPAVSFWQGEKGGGMTLTLTHAATSKRMQAICEAYNVQATPAALWEAMRYQDIVAAAAARLLIFTLPKGLPKTAEEGWAQYLSAWRPGKPHPETWAAHWATACGSVGGV